MGGRRTSCQQRELPERNSTLSSLSQKEQYGTEAFREGPENKGDVADEGSWVSEGTVERWQALREGGRCVQIWGCCRTRVQSVSEKLRVLSFLVAVGDGSRQGQRDLKGFLFWWRRGRGVSQETERSPAQSQAALTSLLPMATWGQRKGIDSGRRSPPPSQVFFHPEDN